jgi:hypothetical protein
MRFMLMFKGDQPPAPDEVVEVASKQEATDLARRFLEIAGGGESEIRQVIDPIH